MRGDPMRRNLPLLTWLSAAALLCLRGPGFAAEPITYAAGSDPQVFCDAVQQALDREDFATLSATVKAARTLTARFPGGRTVLEGFYDTVAGSGCVGNSAYLQPFWRDEKAVDRRSDHLNHWREDGSDPIGSAIALAEFWDDFAWVSSGSSWMSKLPLMENYLFNQRVETASSYLKDMDPRVDAEAYLTLMNLARDQHQSRFKIDALFEEARRQYPTVITYYRDYAEMLMPRWYGARGEVGEFARSLLRDPGGDDGAIFYSRVLERVAYDPEVDVLLAEIGPDWTVARDAFQIREKRYGLSSNAWGALCYLAAASGDRPTAREAFRHWVTHVNIYARGGGGDFFLRILPWIMARDGDKTPPPQL